MAKSTRTIETYIQFSYEQNPQEFMRQVLKETIHKYTCLRPPGAAGAGLVTAKGDIMFGSVHPPDHSKTCKELGACEIEFSYTVDREKDEYSHHHEHCVRTIHAEQRVIVSAAKYGVATQGAILFSLLKPCYQCSKIIVAAGVRKIFYVGAAYDEERTRNVLIAAGVPCIRVDMELGYGN